VTGPLPLTVAGLSPISQAIISPTVVTILFSGTLAGRPYDYPAGNLNAQTYQGGPIAGTTGTFGSTPSTATNIVSAANLGGGNYSITFDQPVTPVGGIDLTQSFLIYSATGSAGLHWEPCSYTGQTGANTITVGIGSTDGTLIVCLRQPINMTAPYPFATAQSQTTI
jgi:hypothetical protein